jgi:hypothetical protein
MEQPEVNNEDFFDIMEERTITQDNQEGWEYEVNTGTQPYKKASKLIQSNISFEDFDEGLVSELQHQMEFALPINHRVTNNNLNQDMPIQTHSNNISILSTVNATKVDKFTPTSKMNPVQPMERNQDTSTTYQGSGNIHPMNNLQNPQVPTYQKPYKLVHEISSQSMKQSHQDSHKDQKNSKVEDLLKTKNILAGKSKTISRTTQTRIQLGTIKSRFTQTDQTHDNNSNLASASRYSKLHELLRSLEAMDLIKSKKLDQSKSCSLERNSILHDFNIEVANLNKQETSNIHLLYERRSYSRKK